MEQFLQWHAQIMDVDRIPTLLAAIMLSCIVGVITGPLLGNANPFLWNVFGKIFGNFGDRLNRHNRPQGDLILRGFIVTIVALALALVLGRYLEALTPLFDIYSLGKITILSLTLTSGTIWFALLRLYFAMEKKQVGQGAYYAIAHTTRRNLTAGDDYGITRAALYLSARSFDKGLVAPALWYIIGGLPAAIIYAALAALSWRFAKDGFNTGFAAIPMALERLMGFIPSIIAAMIITAAASITPTAKLQKGIAAWLGHKNRSPYEQGGFPLSALAWSLNVSLGGASQDISGSAIKAEWVGPDGATAQVSHRHLHRAMFINVIAHIILIASLLALYVWGNVMPF
jgi:adenosylcobinamide-phosphate synthase